MTSFDYRRSLEREDWLRLIGAAAGAGAALGGVVLYFGRIWLQRVPLEHALGTVGPGAKVHRTSRVDPRAPKRPR